MDQFLLKEVVIQQNDFHLDENTIEREIDLPKDKLITIISGIRRCGKSTLLQQIRRKNEEKNYYLNFDDERLFKFQLEDFQTLIEIFISLYGKQNTYYFDEIQNVGGWERFIRRLHDEGNKIYITGSNAKMLSRELGTHLTGRYIQIELFPFSFSEFLKFNHFQISNDSFYKSETKALLNNYFDAYFEYGGFPDFIKTKNPEYLNSLYESILYRDILVRNKILTEYKIKNLVFFISSNVSKLISYNNLKSIVDVKHPETVKKYLTYLQNSYLIFLIYKFDFSIKKQIGNPQKVYFIDTGLASSTGFSFSENKGRILENIVFLELKRRKKDIYYFKKEKKCDFLIFSNKKIKEAIQITVSLENHETYKREIDGLINAMKEYNLKNGTIITRNERKLLEVDGLTINVVPIWQWLLEK